MRGTDPLLVRIARWAHDLTLDQVPPRVVEKLRLQIASTLSATVASAWHGPARAVARARTRAGAALLWATHERRDPLDAAYVNAAFAMSLDMDDYLLSGHTGYSSILVPLAWARSLDDVVLAAAVANEVSGRLSTACLLGPVNGQMNSYIHNGGAALALGKVLGLGPDALANAMALAWYQPNLCLAEGFWHEGAKTITASQAIEQGVRAVELARAGLEGPLRILDHPQGLLASFSFHPLPGLFDRIGDVWFSDTLSYKRFPGTSYISAAVEAALGCSANAPIEPAAIAGVDVETTILSATLDTLGAARLERTPLDSNAVNFSVRLSVATALVTGDLVPDTLRPESLAREEERIRKLVPKVRVAHAWKQSAEMFAESPVGLRVLAQMSPMSFARLTEHLHRWRASTGATDRAGASWEGMLRRLPDLAARLRAAREVPVSDSDVDTVAFRMRQSARVRLRWSDGRSDERFVAVPIGAAGRDPSETRDLVRWRMRLAFGERGDALFDAVRCAGTSIAELEALATAG